MPKGGARPGSGRKRGTGKPLSAAGLNKRRLKAMHRMIDEAAATARVAAQTKGGELFDSVEHLRTVAKQFLGRAVHEQKKEGVEGAGFSRSYFMECLKEASKVLAMIAPYERPKLIAVKHSGDQENPIRATQSFDMSGLTDEQLSALGTLIGAIVAGSAPGVAPAHPAGTTQTSH